MFEFKSYDSAEAMWADLDANMKAADANVREWQSKIAVGDFILTAVEGQPVFSEVLETYPAEEAHLLNYRFCKAYSIFVPEGELGDIHVSSVLAVVSREQFEHAKAAGWQPGSK